MTRNKDQRCYISTSAHKQSHLRFQKSFHRHSLDNQSHVIHLCNCAGVFYQQHQHGQMYSFPNVVHGRLFPKTCMLHLEAHVYLVKQPCMSWSMNSQHCVHDNSHGLDLLHQKYWFCRHDFVVLVGCLQVSTTIYDQCSREPIANPEP
jgi:hypothetical protein